MRHHAIPAALMLLLTATITGCAETDQTTTEPSVTAPVEATPMSFPNSECPIMGGEPTEELTAEYDGKTIGFCCEGCPEKWAALSDEEKAEKFAKVDARAGHDHDAEGHDHSEHASE